MEKMREKQKAAPHNQLELAFYTHAPKTFVRNSKIEYKHITVHCPEWKEVIEVGDQVAKKFY